MNIVTPHSFPQNKRSTPRIKMPTNQTALTATPRITMRDGTAVTNSRDVATIFGKRHDNVLQAIDKLVKIEPSLLICKFEPTISLNAGNGKPIRSYEMTRDGFSLIALSFSNTNDTALKWKINYIDAFNALEDEYRRNRRVSESDALALLEDPAILRKLLANYDVKIIKLELKVQEMAPSVAALDLISGCEGSYTITEAAKILQIQRKQLFAYLQTKPDPWMYRTCPKAEYQPYANKLETGLLVLKIENIPMERKNGEKFNRKTTQIRITQKGVTVLAKSFSRNDENEKLSQQLRLPLAS